MNRGNSQSASGAVAIVAALPRELADLSRHLEAKTVRSEAGIHIASAPHAGSGQKILLATAGMGAERVALAVAAARLLGPIDLLLSVGLAGACTSRLKAGDALQASLIVDSRTGERLQPSADLHLATAGVLVTASEIASVPEKQRLHQSYNAAAVDMEAATVARLAQAHGIGFAALKAISDEETVDLSRLSRFTGSRGQFRTGAFAAQTLITPSTWAPTARLARTSKAALDTLTATLHQFLTR